MVGLRCANIYKVTLHGAGRNQGRPPLNTPCFPPRVSEKPLTFYRFTDPHDMHVR